MQVMHETPGLAWAHIISDSVSALPASLTTVAVRMSLISCPALDILSENHAYGWLRPLPNPGK